MTEQEKLNEKLARWAGFRKTKKYWIAPNGDLRSRACHPNACPNFTDSLDACFEHLVPKSIRTLADSDLSTDREAMYKLFSLWIEEFWMERKQPISIVLALCLAIEKLIDTQKDT